MNAPNTNGAAPVTSPRPTQVGRAPREAMEPAAAAGCAFEAARSALHLLEPWVTEDQRAGWQRAVASIAEPPAPAVAHPEPQAETVH